MRKDIKAVIIPNQAGGREQNVAGRTGRKRRNGNNRGKNLRRGMDGAQRDKETNREIGYCTL